MPLHRARHEIELGRDAQLALAVDEDLAVALHRVETTEESLARATVDPHRTLELGRRQWYAGFGQRVEDRSARRQQRRIDVALPTA